jgi:transcriptional regulator with PAS, ATPase and Fis domain
MRVGSVDTQKADVRIIAATNSDLKKMVTEGKFRDDLYYRLCVITIGIPPLRERREDIPLLAEHFVRFYASENDKPIAGIHPDALRVLLDYDWPGNVRELELVTRQLLALHGHEAALRRGMLPEEIRGATAEPEPVVSGRADRNREEHDLEALSAALKQNGGNLARAAAAAGVSRQRAYRLLAKQGSPERSERVGAVTDPGAEDDGRE